MMPATDISAATTAIANVCNRLSLKKKTTDKDWKEAAVEIDCNAFGSKMSSKKFVQTIDYCYAWTKFYRSHLFNPRELTHVNAILDQIHSARESHRAIPWTKIDDEIYEFYMNWMSNEEFVRFMFKIFLGR